MGFTASSQSPLDKPLKKYAPLVLQQDFLLLRDSLQQIHPGLYRYKSKAVMNALLDSCYSSIRDSMTIYEFFRIVRFVVSAIGDGHAGCTLPPRAEDDLERHIPMFPMRLWFKGDMAYVICDKDSLRAGTEILSIDRHPIGELTSRLFDFIPGDGSIRSGKQHFLNDFDDNFSTLYYFVYGPRPVFTVEYRTFTGYIQKTDLPADYDGHIECDIEGESQPGLALDFKPNRVAVLTVGRFDTEPDKFNSFLQKSFAEISLRQTKALVIDLRNNGGGEDQNGAALYSWLTNKPFDYYASVETIQRTLRPEEHPQLQLQQPAANPFLGNVYILINVETGLLKYTMAVRPATYPDRGIIPDFFPILPSFDDWIRHNDVQLKYALRLAASWLLIE